MTVGILVGCDSKQEWLLSWWYSNLRKHNPELPIAFGDLGMSEKALDWCKNRGILIPAAQIPLLPSPPPSEEGWAYLGMHWRMTKLEDTLVWFRKPFLMKQSPFSKTIWLDLDCEVLGSLAPLYRLRLPPTKMVIRKCSGHFRMVSTDNKFTFRLRSYNSGVVLFEKNSPLLDFWERMTRQAFPYFCGDDYILTFAIEKYGFPVEKIPLKYNWLVQWGSNPEAVVLHWMRAPSKTALRLRINSNVSYDL